MDGEETRKAVRSSDKDDNGRFTFEAKTMNIISRTDRLTNIFLEKNIVLLKAGEERMQNCEVTKNIAQEKRALQRLAQSLRGTAGHIRIILVCCPYGIV